MFSSAEQGGAASTGRPPWLLRQGHGGHKSTSMPTNRNGMNEFQPTGRIRARDLEDYSTLYFATSEENATTLETVDDTYELGKNIMLHDPL